MYVYMRNLLPPTLGAKRPRPVSPPRGGQDSVVLEPLIIIIIIVLIIAILITIIINICYYYYYYHYSFIYHYLSIHYLFKCDRFHAVISITPKPLFCFTSYMLITT